MKQNKSIKQMKKEGDWKKMQFIFSGLKGDHSTVLTNFDQDASHICYNGKQFLCTGAFLEALRTGTFINYQLQNVQKKCFNKRITKYQNDKLLDLIVPKEFKMKFVDNSESL